MTAILPPFDEHAFDFFAPEGPEAPLLIDSPHSGRVYPADFETVVPYQVLRGAEDWMGDDLGGAAPQAGRRPASTQPDEPPPTTT